MCSLVEIKQTSGALHGHTSIDRYLILLTLLALRLPLVQA